MRKRIFLDGFESKGVFLTLRYLFPYFLRWTVYGALIGGIVGSVSAGFLVSLDWVTTWREQHPWVIVFLPLAGLAMGYVYYRYGRDIQSGNNVLIDTIHEPKETIPMRMALFIYLSTLLTHLVGGSAGREGTALQMAGGLMDSWHKVLRLNEETRRQFLIASVAAGFGAVFGTPLAGTLFALEFFRIGKIQYAAIFPTLMAAIMADTVTRMWQVKHAVFVVPDVPVMHAEHLAYALLAGLIFGICAWVFSTQMRYASEKLFARIARPPLRPFVGGLMLLLCIWMLDTTRFCGLGVPVIEQSFIGVLSPGDFLIKLVLTIITLSSGFKGGEVTPLFFIGATLGNALHAIIPLPFPLLSGMGFVAVFAGATNTPLACTLMAIELFGADVAVYAALACVVSYLVSGHTGIYVRQRIGKAKHADWQADEEKVLDELSQNMH